MTNKYCKEAMSTSLVYIGALVQIACVDLTVVDSIDCTTTSLTFQCTTPLTRSRTVPLSPAVIPIVLALHRGQVSQHTRNILLNWHDDELRGSASLRSLVDHHPVAHRVHNGNHGFIVSRESCAVLRRPERRHIE